MARQRGARNATAQCNDELRALGRLPTKEERVALSEKYRCNATTIWRRAQRIYGATPRPQEGTATGTASHQEVEGSPRSPAKDDVATAAPQAVDFGVDATEVAPEQLPPPEASMPIEDAASTTSTTSTPAAAAQRAAVAIPTKQIIGGLVKTMNVRFEKGGIEPVSDEETDVLVAAWDPVFQQYLPVWLEKHGPIIFAGIATASILGPRFYAAYETRDQRAPPDPSASSPNPHQAAQEASSPADSAVAAAPAVVQPPPAPQAPPPGRSVMFPKVAPRVQPEDELAAASADSISQAFGGRR
jgi:hypothetical protein